MINYSPVSTNDELLNKLDDRLSNGFEDNICAVLGDYYSHEHEHLGGGTYFKIAKFYEESKNAYLEALAAIIMYPEALDYLD